MRRLLSYIRTDLNMKYLPLICLFFIVSCKTDSTNKQAIVKHPKVNFDIPSNFDIRSYDSEYDQILALSYKDQLQITVYDFLDKQMKNGMFEGPGMILPFGNLRFEKFKNQYLGTNVSDFQASEDFGNKYVSGSFDSSQDNMSFHCIYGCMFVKEPEMYYETYFVSKAEFKEQNESIIIEFLKAIK